MRSIMQPREAPAPERESSMANNRAYAVANFLASGKLTAAAAAAAAAASTLGANDAEARRVAALAAIFDWPTTVDFCTLRAGNRRNDSAHLSARARTFPPPVVSRTLPLSSRVPTPTRARATLPVPRARAPRHTPLVAARFQLLTRHQSTVAPPLWSQTREPYTPTSRLVKKRFSVQLSGPPHNTCALLFLLERRLRQRDRRPAAS